jgi:hypothetical protein
MLSSSLIVGGFVAAAGTALGLELTGLELFEKIGVEDRRADLVVARGPLTEIDQTAAIRAERNVFAREIDGFFADGAEEGFR